MFSFIFLYFFIIIFFFFLWNLLVLGFLPFSFPLSLFYGKTRTQEGLMTEKFEIGRWHRT